MNYKFQIVNIFEIKIFWVILDLVESMMMKIQLEGIPFLFRYHLIQGFVQKVKNLLNCYVILLWIQTFYIFF